MEIKKDQEICDLFNATQCARTNFKIDNCKNSSFIETDSVKDRLRSGRSTSASNDEKSATILQSFIKMPNTSTRKVATENEVSQSSVCNILKKHRFHLCKKLYV